MASKALEGLLKGLGWKFSDDPKKAFPFAEEVDVLGVRLSVGDLHAGSLGLLDHHGITTAQSHSQITLASRPDSFDP